MKGYLTKSNNSVEFFFGFKHKTETKCVKIIMLVLEKWETCLWETPREYKMG